MKAMRFLAVGSGWCDGWQPSRTNSLMVLIMTSQGMTSGLNWQDGLKSPTVTALSRQNVSLEGKYHKKNKN